MKMLETFGAICGIIGAFLVALKLGNIGYPFFLASSFSLLFTAIKYRQWNFIALQGVYFTANVIGFFNYI